MMQLLMSENYFKNYFKLDIGLKSVECYWQLTWQQMTFWLLKTETFCEHESHWSLWMQGTGEIGARKHGWWWLLCQHCINVQCSSILKSSPVVSIIWASVAFTGWWHVVNLVHYSNCHDFSWTWTLLENLLMNGTLRHRMLVG